MRLDDTTKVILIMVMLLVDSMDVSTKLSLLDYLEIPLHSWIIKQRRDELTNTWCPGKWKMRITYRKHTYVVSGNKWIRKMEYFSGADISMSVLWILHAYVREIMEIKGSPGPSAEGDHYVRPSGHHQAGCVRRVPRGSGHFFLQPYPDVEISNLHKIDANIRANRMFTIRQTPSKMILYCDEDPIMHYRPKFVHIGGSHLSERLIYRSPPPDKLSKEGNDTATLLRWILINNPFRYDVNMGAFNDVHHTGFMNFVDLDLSENEQHFLSYWEIKDVRDWNRFEREAPRHVIALFRGIRMEEEREMDYQDAIVHMKPKSGTTKLDFMDSLLDTASKEDPSDVQLGEVTEFSSAMSPSLQLTALDLDPSFIKSLLPAPTGASRVGLLSPMQFTKRGNLIARLITMEIFNKHSRSPSTNKVLGRAIFTLSPIVMMQDRRRENYEQRVRRLALFAAVKMLYRHAYMGWHILSRQFLQSCKTGLTLSDVRHRMAVQFSFLEEEPMFFMRD